MIQDKAINTLRFLGVDAIEKANSGHPGIVLGAAPIVYTLFKDFIRIDARYPSWYNRDRFILSAGHGSALLYAMNHLAGYDLSIEDIQNFRTFGHTPGHPEYDLKRGIETTSGPLGQGVSNAVGMALAAKHIQARFNKEDIALFDQYIYTLVGDGDLQEGVALEALSLAGHLKLSNLVILFDSNDIQLDGEVKYTFSEDTKKKMEALGFYYIKVLDGMNPDAIKKAIKKGQRQQDKPFFIEVKTQIGFGSDVAGTSSAHGKPLSKDQITALRNNLNYTLPPFEVDQDVYDFYRKHTILRGRRAYRNYQKQLEIYKKAYPNDYELLSQFLTPLKMEDLAFLDDLQSNKPEATRVSSGKVLDTLSKHLPNMIGGSADLSSSTKAKGFDGHFMPDHLLGRNINFGVREHAMGAIVNGMTLFGGLHVFGGAFFVFSDYMKPSIRLSAIMNIPSIFVMTHDSIGVGEDGPTHQPVEQLAGLRAIPNLNVFRPANLNETKAYYKHALTHQTPSVFVLSRQDVTQFEADEKDILKGGYIASKESLPLQVVLLATGSEVTPSLEAQKQLEQDNIGCRVVSIPHLEGFLNQSSSYIQQILPKGVLRVAIEAGAKMPWYQLTHHIIGMTSFGESADGDLVMKHFGFDQASIVAFVKEFV
jgi:transketolase